MPQLEKALAGLRPFAERPTDRRLRFANRAEAVAYTGQWLAAHVHVTAGAEGKTLVMLTADDENTPPIVISVESRKDAAASEKPEAAR